MSNSLEKINILPFSRKKSEDFSEWMAKSMSLAKARGWIDAIDSSFNADTDEKKTMDSSGTQYFTLACSSKAFKIIKNKKTTKEMVAALKDRYEENEMEGYMNLLEKFTTSKLADHKDDVEEWMLDLEDLNLQMKEIDAAHEKSDAEMRAKILMSLPPEYSEIVTVEKEKPNKTLSATQKSLVNFYERKFKSLTNESKEIALVNVECYRCGKPGHKSNQCKVKRFSRSTFKGNCNHCGKKGHKKAQCWELEANKDKRPKKWKSSMTGRATDNDEISEI